VLTYAFTAETTSLMDVRRLVDGKVTNRIWQCLVWRR
jgi:hypothetical protein